MDIELKLREMLVLRDPGVRFTDNVLSRVGDVPRGRFRDRVVRLADARMSRRGRHVLLGTLVVVGVAAAMLPFMPERGVDAPGVQESVALAVPAGGDPAADPVAPMAAVQSDPPDDGESVIDCVDPDVLYGLLLPFPLGETFRIISAAPPELAAFEAPRQLVWLGGTERSPGGTTQSSAVYRTDLAPAAARAAAAEALMAGGWTLHSDGRLHSANLFVSAGSQPFGETYCREGRPVNLTASTLEGVTYVVLSASRADRAAGYSNACEQPPQFAARSTSPLDAHMPTLEPPRDPATGQPVAVSGGVSSSGDSRRQASAGFTLKDSVDNVARHFGSQMAGQGWHADTSWSGAGTAGSTWTRRLDDDAVLQGMLVVSAFEGDRFTAVFRAVRTN